MAKSLDGVKKITNTKVSSDQQAPEEGLLLAQGARKLSGTFARIFDTDTYRARRERQQAQDASRREEKARREHERLARITTERHVRTEKVWQSAQAAKERELEKKRQRERAQRARAKLRAEKMAFKLQRRSGAVLTDSTATAVHTMTSSKQAIGRLIFAGMARGSRRICTSGITLLQKSFSYVVIIGVSAIALVAVLAIPIYTPVGTTSLRQVIIYHVPFPALVVDYRPVSYLTYRNEEHLLGDYYLSHYETDSDHPATVEVLDVLVRDALIEKSILTRLQRRYQVVVSSAEQEAAFVKIAEAQGGTEVFTDTLYNTYGLPKSVFIERVAFYEALRPKLAAAFVSDSSVHRSARLRIDNISTLLAKQTQSFEELARRYSEDEHALKGGDIGYVKVGDMSPELVAAVATLDRDMVSGVLQEPDGYYIVKVYDRTQTKIGEEVALKKISILTNYEFEDYLSDLRDNARVWDWMQK